MFIHYKDTNVHALPHITYREKRLKNRHTGKVRVVQQIDTNQSPQDIKWLQPGWNEFPKAVWDQNKDNPQIQLMLKRGKIVVMEEKVSILKGGKRVTKVVGQVDEEVRLRWFDEKRALAIVADTYNREILTRWMDEETRTRVKKKLTKQLEPLLSKADDDDRDDDQDEMADEE